MPPSRIEFPERRRDNRCAGHVRSPWRASATLGFLLLSLTLLSLTACTGDVTGSESAEALEQREAEAKAEEQGNPTN